MLLRHVLAAGLSLGLVSASTHWVSAEEKENDDNGQVVKIDQLPAAVKATLVKAAEGGKIEEIEKETEDGKTTYDADVVIKGQKWEIEISEDGKLLGKNKDNDDDDKDEKGDHQNKGEHKGHEKD